MITRKKLGSMGTSRYFIVPSEWLNYLEQNRGKPIEEVLLDIEADKIIITIEPDSVKTLA